MESFDDAAYPLHAADSNDVPLHVEAVSGVGNSRDGALRSNGRTTVIRIFVGDKSQMPFPYNPKDLSDVKIHLVYDDGSRVQNVGKNFLSLKNSTNSKPQMRCDQVFVFKNVGDVGLPFVKTSTSDRCPMVLTAELKTNVTSKKHSTGDAKTRGLRRFRYWCSVTFSDGCVVTSTTDPFYYLSNPNSCASIAALDAATTRTCEVRATVPSTAAPLDPVYIEGFDFDAYSSVAFNDAVVPVSKIRFVSSTLLKVHVPHIPPGKVSVRVVSRGSRSRNDSEVDDPKKGDERGTGGFAPVILNVVPSRRDEH
jgi:hypothetical protein